MIEPRTVICMKWGTLYPAEYVNVLFNAMKQNLTGDFRFVCLTDDPAGFEDGIESFAIPDIGLNVGHAKIGAWPKLSVFLGDLYGLSGRGLFVDLDTVVLDNMDCFFEVPGPFVALDHAVWTDKTAAPKTMSSIFAFDIGTQNWLVDRFRANRDALVHQYGLEQNYLHGELPDKHYWPQDWIVSFKRHVRRPLLVDRFLGPKRPEAPARVIVFHGDPRPIDLIRPPKGNWDIFPHYGRGSVPWMQDYWRTHGGTI